MPDTTHESRSSTLKRNLMVISSIVFIAFLVFMLVMAITEEENEIVPLLNLSQTLHIILLTIIWPVIGGTLAVLVFPRLLVPLILRLKRISNKKYSDCVIQLEHSFNLKFVLKRAFGVFLLVMGLESAILPMIDITILYRPSQLTEGGIVEELLPYNPQAFIVTAAILFPLALILWMVVWNIQDSGLMHYHLSTESTKYQEIEPVFFRISGYIRGFSGISAFFFYLNAIYQIALAEILTEWLNFVWILLVSVIVMVWSLPFIIMHSYLKLGWVTKDLKIMGRLTVEDLKLTS